jgi:hypothetical protein
MILTALILSRLQFAFTITFHIIFPSFTIELAAWLCVLEGLHLVTARPVYRRLFDLRRCLRDGQTAPTALQKFDRVDTRTFSTESEVLACFEVARRFMT